MSKIGENLPTGDEQPLTYLLTWNPNRWEWEMDNDVSEIKAHGFFDSRWSCGHTRHIKAGDRLFLLRQGREPRGIMASGYAKSSPYPEKHWNKSRSDEALYIDARFDSLLVPEQDGVLPLSRLQNGPLAAVNWRTQSSGISITPSAAFQLEKLWSTFLEEREHSRGLLSKEQRKDVASPRRSATDLEDVCRRLVPAQYWDSVLHVLGRSIELAHESRADSWGVRIDDKSIMLKVGPHEVLQILSPEKWSYPFHLIVEKEAVPSQLRSLPELHFSGTTDYYLKSRNL